MAEDRRLDLDEPLRELVAAGRRRDAELYGLLVGRRERARPTPGDLLERETQRLGVGELAVEQRQRRRQGGELGVGEGDRRKVEVLRPQRVVLLLGQPVDRLLDGQRDPQRLELGPVGVEAPGEGVLVHPAVALDVSLDVERGDRAALGHQVGDQRELADQLLCVLGHRRPTIDRAAARPARRAPYLGELDGARVGGARSRAKPCRSRPLSSGRGSAAWAAEPATAAPPPSRRTPVVRARRRAS